MPKFNSRGPTFCFVRGVYSMAFNSKVAFPEISAVYLLSMK